MRYSMSTFKMPRGCGRYDGQHHVTSQGLSGLPLGYLDFFWALVAGLPQMDPGAAAVLVDELDARGLDPSLGTSFGSNVNLRSVFTSLWTALVEVHIRVA